VRAVPPPSGRRPPHGPARQCLVADHRRRPSARELLRHPFLANRTSPRDGWRPERGDWSALLERARAAEAGGASSPGGGGGGGAASKDGGGGPGALPGYSGSSTKRDLRQLATVYVESAQRRQRAAPSGGGASSPERRRTALLPPDEQLDYLSLQVGGSRVSGGCCWRRDNDNGNDLD